LKNLQQLYRFKIEQLSRRYDEEPVMAIKNTLKYLNRMEIACLSSESNSELSTAREMINGLETTLVRHMLDENGTLSSEFFGNNNINDGSTDFPTAITCSIPLLIDKMNFDIDLIDKNTDSGWLRNFFDSVVMSIKVTGNPSMIIDSLNLELVLIVQNWITCLKGRPNTNK